MENLFREEQKKLKKRKKAAKSTLSFAMDDEGDGGDTSVSSTTYVDNGGEEQSSKRAKFRKNPNVDTSFLPDRDREEAERREREALRQEWLRKQEEMKKDEIEITYSYWDGSGHRKSVVVCRSFDLSRYRSIHSSPPPHSARKAMKLALSWRSADSSFLNFGMSVLTI